MRCLALYGMIAVGNAEGLDAGEDGRVVMGCGAMGMNPDRLKILI